MHCRYRTQGCDFTEKLSTDACRQHENMCEFRKKCGDCLSQCELCSKNFANKLISEHKIECEEEQKKKLEALEEAVRRREEEQKVNLSDLEILAHPNEHDRIERMMRDDELPFRLDARDGGPVPAPRP